MEATGIAGTSINFQSELHTPSGMSSPVGVFGWESVMPMACKAAIMLAYIPWSSCSRRYLESNGNITMNLFASPGGQHKSMMPCLGVNGITVSVRSRVLSQLRSVMSSCVSMSLTLSSMSSGHSEGLKPGITWLLCTALWTISRISIISPFVVGYTPSSQFEFLTFLRGLWLYSRDVV